MSKQEKNVWFSMIHLYVHSSGKVRNEWQTLYSKWSEAQIRKSSQEKHPSTHSQIQHEHMSIYNNA